MAKFLTGSTYFFSEYPDFKSKDIDEIEIVDEAPFKYLRQLSGMGHCLFQLKKQPSKEDYIKYSVENQPGMAIAKFLVPEFCKEIGVEIEDLPKLQPLADRLDIKHKYLGLIYQSYLENNSFSLTPEQRLKAYNSYKESRGI
jgi:hypothetical protein